ncbi:MAG: PEP-CTERM sorting domain-containing protein [Planctomycetes bacterium]|nr:PEP-CTERM sorting domain-containing protein [Planctomycetota bacterium]
MTKFYRFLGKCTLAVSLCVLPMLSASASDSYEFQTVVGAGAGLSLPTDIAFAPGQTDRIYVTEFFATPAGGGAPVGRVSSVDLATGTRATFLEVSGIDLSLEGGLHSITFHPDFATNNKFYLGWTIAAPEFTTGSPRAGRIDEYTVVGGVPILQRTILELGNEFHGVGDISFDPTATGSARDYLYIALGDGGPQADNAAYVNRAQDLGDLRGKILRVGVDGVDDLPGDASRNYSLPASNPYNDADTSTDGAVWLSGFRNPWRFSFDRDSGDMYIGDVGFNSNEEVNFVAAGESGIDFGWAQREGTIATPDAGVLTQPWYTGLKGTSRDPFFEGNHDHPNHDTNASLAGGFVYRGPIAELQGKYFFADTRTDKLFMLDFDPTTDPASFDGLNHTNYEDITAEALADLGLSTFEGTFTDSLVSFGEDASGNLYFANLNGEIYSIVSVPEPSSWILMVSALLLATRRRGRKN